jgi:hypothetical protein
MVGYHPVDEDGLSLGMAKFVHGGVADHQRKLQIIFFTQQLSYTSQLRASRLQHQTPPPWQIDIKKNPPAAELRCSRGGGPHFLISS